MSRSARRARRGLVGGAHSGNQVKDAEQAEAHGYQNDSVNAALLQILFAAGITFEKISTAVSALRLSELRSFRPVEIFRGGAIPTREYSLLLRATFQSTERTLRDDEVALWSTQIIKALQALGGTLRA